MSNADSLRRSSRKRKPSSKVKSERDGSQQPSDGSTLSIASQSPPLPSPLPSRQGSAPKLSQSRSQSANLATQQAAQPTSQPDLSTRPVKSIKLTLKRTRSDSTSLDSAPTSPGAGGNSTLGRPRMSKRRRVTPNPDPALPFHATRKDFVLPEQLERAFGDIGSLYDSEIPPLDLAADVSILEPIPVKATSEAERPVLTPVAPEIRSAAVSAVKTATALDSPPFDLPLPRDHLSLRPSNAQRAFFNKRSGYKGFYVIDHFNYFYQPEPELPRFLGGESVDFGSTAKVQSPGKRKRDREVRESQRDDDYMPVNGRRRPDKRSKRKVKKGGGGGVVVPEREKRSTEVESSPGPMEITA